MDAPLLIFVAPPACSQPDLLSIEGGLKDSVASLPIPSPSGQHRLQMSDLLLTALILLVRPLPLQTGKHSPDKERYNRDNNLFLRFLVDQTLQVFLPSSSCVLAFSTPSVTPTLSLASFLRV